MQDYCNVYHDGNRASLARAIGKSRQQIVKMLQSKKGYVILTGNSKNIHEIYQPIGGIEL